MRTKHLLEVINQSVCAISILLATSYLAASAPLPVPERGFVSSQPAKIWEEGLICGNGTIGANALSRPLNERIIFTHERLFMRTFREFRGYSGAQREKALRVKCW